MLKRSNIVAAEEDLQAFYQDLEAHSLAALWNQGGGGAPEPRCLFRKSGTSRTSCPRKRASSPHGARLLDSRFRGNDARPQALAVYL